LERGPWLPPGHVCFTVAPSYRDATTLAVLATGETFDPARLVGLRPTALADLDRDAEAAR
jgi:hypothetical protein